MAPIENPQKVYNVLERLGIPYVRHDHPPVYTVEQAEWTSNPVRYLPF